MSEDRPLAAPNLPFGVRLRVTDVATGRSVIVRVNDRGPFVPGRVVDISYFAAASLGIIGRDIAMVRLDVNDEIARTTAVGGSPVYRTKR